MFALLLAVPHAKLVWKERFPSEEAARTFAKTLPGSFEIVSEESLPTDCEEIPIKDEKPCDKPSVK